jgi:hypothetical protein
MTISALIVPVPEAEGVVGEHRRRHDPSASFGGPAARDAARPVRPPSRIDDRTLDALRKLFHRAPGFSFVLPRTATFPRTLYLAPEPAEPFLALTRELVARWPEHPPYGGAFDEAVPHVTVVHDVDDATLEAARRAVEPELPIRASAREVHLYVGENAPPGWMVRERFRLGPGV